MEHLGFKVRVSCMTFNHAPFIVDAMNGFTMQQTTFPFVCIIVDDASTDGEQEIISHYLENNFDLDDKAIVRKEETEDYRLVFAQHKTNLNCYFVVFFLKYNHYSIKKPKMLYVKEFTDTKYVTICEGDDYWIAPDKLEKQVDFLEQNDDFVLSYTNAIIVDKDSKVINKLSHKRYSGTCTKSLIIEGNYIITAGVCFRNKFLKEWSEVFASIPFNLMLSDKPLWIFLSTKGQFHYLKDYMVAYRRLEESASHTKDYDKSILYSDNVKNINLYFNKLYNIGISENRIIQDIRLHKLLSTPILNWKGFSIEFLKAVVDYPHFLLRKRYWKTLVRSLKSKIHR